MIVITNHILNNIICNIKTENSILTLTYKNGGVWKNFSDIMDKTEKYVALASSGSDGEQPQSRLQVWTNTGEFNISKVCELKLSGNIYKIEFNRDSTYDGTVLEIHRKNKYFSEFANPKDHIVLYIKPDNTWELFSK